MEENVREEVLKAGNGMGVKAGSAKKMMVGPGRRRRRAEKGTAVQGGSLL